MMQIIKQVRFSRTAAEVWNQALGTPEALCRWLPSRVEGAMSPNEVGALIWGEHRSEVLWTEILKPTKLAFQWHPGDSFNLDDKPKAELTTVTFSLEDDDTGCVLTVLETGFENVPDGIRMWTYDQNNGGWEEELEKLEKLLNT